MNFFNLPAVDQAAQKYKANEFAMGRAQVEAEREDTAYSEEQQLANTRWLAGATKVLMGIQESNPDGFYPAAEELGRLGMERGIIDPESFDAQVLTPERVNELHDMAMVELGGRKISDVDTELPSQVQRYQFYRDQIAGDPEAEDMWDQATQTDRGYQTVEIPMPDGTTRTVNYDRRTGQGYDLTTGQTMIIRPGQNGQVFAYDPSGENLIGASQPQQSAAPEGFGTSQNPAQARREIEETVDEVEEAQRRRLAVRQQLTAVETGYRLMPQIRQSMEDVNAWTSGWGAFLTRWAPGSEARDLEANITTIKANIGFDRLQRMRAESPTGGALGQVAVQELVALQATIANLDQLQSEDQLRDQLRIVFAQYDSWLRSWGEAIMREGTQEQRERYYEMLPSGATFVHPDGSLRVKP